MSCISLSPLALTACGGTEAADTVTGNSSLNVSVASALGAFDNVSAIRLTITETNADGSPKAGPWTYTRDLQRNGNVWTTNVGGVPLGHYHVVAEARNAGGTVLFAGEDRVHVSTDDTFMMTIIMQEDFDPTLTNQSPLFRSVTGNKANVNHGETLSLRIGATDPDGNTGLQLVDGTYDGSSGDIAYFTRTWTPGPSDSGPTQIMLELIDAEGNRSAMSVTVNVGGTGDIAATMVVNLAPTIFSLTSNVDTSGSANAQGHFSSTMLVLEARDGDYYSGTKGEAGKRQDHFTYSWSIEDTGACTGSFNGEEAGQLTVTTLGSSNGAYSTSVKGEKSVRFTLLSIAEPENCWLNLTVTDQWLGKATARVQVDTSRVQPFFVPNLQLSIQSHDEITEIASGFLGGILDDTLDMLQFEVYADGIPDEQEANIEWTWSIAGQTVPKIEAQGVDDLMVELNDLFGDAVPTDIDAFYNGIPFVKSAAAGASLDFDQNRAYSTLLWWAWQKVNCYEDAAGEAYTDVVVTATANGVTDSITFPVKVEFVRATFCLNNSSI